MKSLTASSALALILATTTAGAQTAPQQQARDDYCAHGFLTAQTKQDGAISKTDATQLAQREFNALDANGDGRVTPAEFRDCLTRSSTSQQLALSPPASAGRDESSFQKAADANGIIDRPHFMMGAKNEFREMMAQTAAAGQRPVAFAHHFIVPASDESGQASSGSGARRMSENEAAARAAYGMKSLDNDGDGTVDRDEWRAAHQGISPTRADAEFRRLNRSGNGLLTRDEYVNARLQSFDKAQQEASADGGAQDVVPVWIFYVHE
jgi:Ca2+-binding EF-hand superfamily protein